MRTVYVYDWDAGRLVEKPPPAPPKPWPTIIGDWPAFRSPITGEEISGRRAAQEHAKRHDCVIVGNDLPPERYGGPGGYYGD